MNANEIKKAGATIGADFENGVETIAKGLVAVIFPIVRELPKGKAAAMMASFWEQFAANAPTYGTLKRVTVTRSESMRLAAGVRFGFDRFGLGRRYARLAHAYAADFLWCGAQQLIPSARGHVLARVNASR